MGYKPLKFNLTENQINDKVMWIDLVNLTNKKNKMKKNIKTFKTKIFYLSLVSILLVLLPLFVILERVGIKKDFSSLISNFLKRNTEKINANCGCSTACSSGGGDNTGCGHSCGNF
jgi:hypothetical protein